MSFMNPDFVARARTFDRGFVDTPETDTLHPGATPDAKNAFFYNVEISGDQKRASMGKRPGARLVTPAAMVASQKVDGLLPFTRENANNALLAACNGAWFQFDEVNAFTPIAGATGYTPGHLARLVSSKNQAFLHDGTKQQLYDGTTVRDVGFVKPTGVSNMVTFASGGTNIPGTYDARYVWYDQAHDHESSPAVANTAPLVVAANEGRRHTKPAGAPPTQVTHWRAYVRRTDINEMYWFRAGTFPIGSATGDETTIDAARVDRLPMESENDPPVVTFANLAIWKGYAIGSPVNSSDMYVSKQGDVESWPPKNKFGVSSGDGRFVTSYVSYGTELIAFKRHKAWHLVGERVPFEIDPIHGSFGNVSPEAAIEVAGRLYAWDEVRGPYWTNLSNAWVPLADYRVQQIVKTVNKLGVSDIRVMHAETLNLIIWAVPTTGSLRKRTLLAYHYDLDAWLPPITGLEYGSLAQYLTPAGTIGVYMGDEWGRVYELFSGNRDGVPSGTKQGTVTAATPNTLTDSGAAFFTTGAGLAGMPVAVRSSAGAWQWRRIASNTATELTLDTTNGAPWSSVPVAGDTYIVGGIEWHWWTPWLDMQRPELRKSGQWLFLQVKPSSSSHVVEVHARFDDDEGVTQSQSFTFATGTLSGVWGEAIWGSSLFGSLSRRVRKTRIGRSFDTMQLRFRNYYPDQPIQVAFYAVTADALRRRRSRGAA